MECEVVREWSGAWMLGEASGEPPSAVAEHLSTCDRCRREVEEARAAWADLGMLDTPLAMPAGVARKRGERRIMNVMTWGMWAAVLAVAVGLGAALGWTAGRGGTEPAPAVAPEAAAAAGQPYLLLIRETPATADVISRVGMEALVAEYSAWAGSLAEAGQLIGAEKLTEHGSRVTASGLEGVDGTAPNAVSGYFLVRAADAEAAAEIARRSPHVRYGGVVEVRAVDVEAGG